MTSRLCDWHELGGKVGEGQGEYVFLGWEFREDLGSGIYTINPKKGSREAVR